MKRLFWENDIWFTLGTVTIQTSEIATSVVGRASLLHYIHLHFHHCLELKEIKKIQQSVRSRAG